MLVLKRRRDQVVWIGADILVRIIRIEHGAVELGIEAPGKLISRGEDLKPEGTDTNASTQAPRCCPASRRKDNVR
jgi:carbon storage regulator CsrA